ncbi:MAG: hypothetical protein LBI03_06305 [Clostridiales bacterium]|jgi:hypothetical protein|nr:hypothetical protein [Clostridiales bacterium]
MKKVEWDSGKNLEIFFKMLRSSTANYSWDRNCFILKINSNNRFIITYHKAYVWNSFARNLYGKVESTPNGIKINASVRINLFIFIFYIICLMSLFLPLFVFIRTPQVVFFILLFIFMVALPFLFKGHPEKAISLMDRLCDDRF